MSENTQKGLRVGLYATQANEIINAINKILYGGIIKYTIETNGLEIKAYKVVDIVRVDIKRVKK